MARFPARKCLPFVLSTAAPIVARIVAPMVRAAERQLDSVLADVLLPGPLGLVVHRFSRDERAVAAADVSKAAAADAADAGVGGERCSR
ncbi:hypothetical protein CLOM_g20121 [Closterium sp. NIES-68]|nr:hypothetical protein CLOM_g20121 [Closterium sp. NIES-68]GJP77861.1 hypothetical protein CLOP_g8195 [Closterium sp. NIES-67]